MDVYFSQRAWVAGVYLDLMGDSSHESCSGGGGGDCDGDGWVDYQVNTITVATPGGFFTKD